MGTEFFWFYDVILAAILIGMMFIGAKKGFVRMVLRLCAFAASFVIALMISNGVSGWIYDSFISKPLEQTISTSINDALGDNVVTQIGKIDMEKAKINGKSIDSLELKADKAGKVTVNLGNVNLSNTGISKVDLTSFGVDKNIDYSNINLGSVQIYESDIEKYGIEEIYGGHTEPNLPKGVFGFKPGPLQAASDSVYITLRGKGTHGGRPHLGVDPIPVAAQIVTALQTIVSRKVDPIESAVVSICSINCGNFKANNVVQSELTMSGTVRTFLPEIRDLAEENIRAMVTGIAAANGCTVELVYDRMIGSVINGEAQTNAALEATKALLGEDHVRVIRPFMSSEDFSEFLNRIPGAIMRVGIRDDEHQVSLHNQQMDFNDEVLPVAVSVVANMAVKRLEALEAFSG